VATTETRTHAPWRVFEVTVAAVERLSPSFRRFTLMGEDLEHYADLGPDARVKVLLPLPESGYAHLPRTEPWFEAWRSLPEEQRNPMRTYTTRAVRRPGGPVPPRHGSGTEVVIDMVVHGDTGPATRWARRAEVGAPLALLGPDLRSEGPHGGVEFREPPAGVPLLLAGDETAVPAITSILERLPQQATGAALLEVPEDGDRWEVAAPPGVEVTWLARNGVPHGTHLVPAVERAAARIRPPRRLTVELPEVDVDREILWEVAEAPPTCDVYAWLAGEAAVIRTLRRHLVTELGVDRKCVSFMGYWRAGRSEN